MATLISRINSQIDKIVSENEGSVLEGYKSIDIPIVLKCKNGHIFNKILSDLRSGKWCDKCSNNSYDVLENVFKELDLSYEYSSSFDEIPNVTFDYKITGSGIKFLLDVDKQEDFFQEEKRKEIKRKIELCINSSLRVIRIGEILLSDKNFLDEFLFDAITSNKQVYLYDESKYSWLDENDKDTINVPKEIEPSKTELTKEIEPSKTEKIELTKIEETQPTTKFEEPITFEYKKKHIEKLLSENKNVALAYCRVSTQYQVKDGVSLETQEHQIRDYAKSRGMVVGWVFKDEGISGREMHNRPAFNEMLELVGPRIQVVVISISRLSRNLEQRIQISKKIDEMKGSLMILDLQIDTSSAIGSMLLNLMSNVAEYESRASGERISSNMLHLSKQGRLRGKPPFGWKFVAKKIPFVREESEQKTIEYIRTIVAENPDLHLSGICKILNKEGYKCRRAKSWRSDRLRVIMEQNQIPVIIGEKSTDV
jgi:site-specific DNA recombinase